MVMEMEILSENELINLRYNNNLFGGEAELYNCTYHNYNYLYKKNFCYLSEEQIIKWRELYNIDKDYLVLPRYLVKDKTDRIIGYLMIFYENYKSFYELNLETKDEKIKLLKMAKNKIIDMHKQGIIHCDLHIANIIYQHNDIKLIDFDSCAYHDIRPSMYNKFSKEYLQLNQLSPSVDIFNFNINTISILYNINWTNVFKMSYVFDELLNTKQKEIWEKVKTKKELSNNDFLINYY